MPEGGYNALVAGLYDVPVVFVAGDRAFVDQARGLLGPVEAVVTKTVVGNGAIDSLSPATAQRQITDGVERAVRARGTFKPYKLTPPYTMVLKVHARSARSTRAPSAARPANRSSGTPTCSKCSTRSTP